MWEWLISPRFAEFQECAGIAPAHSTSHTCNYWYRRELRDKHQVYFTSAAFAREFTSEAVIDGDSPTLAPGLFSANLLLPCDELPFYVIVWGMQFGKYKWIRKAKLVNLKQCITRSLSLSLSLSLSRARAGRHTYMRGDYSWKKRDSHNCIAPTYTIRAHSINDIARIHI